MPGLYFFALRVVTGLSLVVLIIIARYYLGVSPFLVLCFLAFIFGYEYANVNQKCGALAYGLKDYVRRDGRTEEEANAET